MANSCLSRRGDRCSDCIIVPTSRQCSSDSQTFYFILINIIIEYSWIYLLRYSFYDFITLVIPRSLSGHTSEDSLQEAQCGFQPGSSTIDMVFTMRQIQEKCIEQQMDLYSVFTDLKKKAFDTVNREAFWSVLFKLGCPRKFTKLMRLFHDIMTGRVLSNGEYSNSFAISNGVKQGCVLAPVLLNLFFTQVLLHAVLDLGVYIKYRLDGSLFDLRHLSAQTKTLEKLITEDLFAGDCALMAHRENHQQIIVDRFADAARLFGLTMSW